MTARSERAVLEVDGVSKRYATALRRSMRYGVRDILAELDPRRRTGPPALRQGEFWALEDVTFSVGRGDAVGVVGANGAGKTTLLRILHGLSRPDAGAVRVAGRSAALIELGVSFDPLATGREAMETETALLGLDRSTRESLYEQILDFADLGAFVDVPVLKYSQGMRMRLGYAIAAVTEPDVLLVDEVLAVGDVAFQRKCLNFISEYRERGGSVVLVTHDLWAVRMVCSRCIVLDHGRIVADGEVDSTITTYLSDYLAVGEAEQADDDRAVGSGGHGARLASTVDRGLDVGSVSISGVDGAVEPLASATVRIELEGGAAGEELVVAFTITANGQMIPLVRSESSVSAPGPGRCCTVEAQIASVPLMGGSYLLRVLVLDPITGELVAQRGWTDEALQFVVHEEERLGRTLIRIAGVMVMAEVDWGPGDAVDAVGEVSP